jgi:hypothetical protein
MILVAASVGEWLEDGMTQAAPEGDRSGATGHAPSEDFTLDEAWRLGSAASAALDQLDRPGPVDEAYDHYLLQLRELDVELHHGRIASDELSQRRHAIVAELRDAILHTQSGTYPSRINDLLRELDPVTWPETLFVPIGSAPPGVPARHRYALPWTSADLPNLVQMKSASVDNGRLHVVNLTDPAADTGKGFAQAGLGILVRPKKPLSRLTFRPEVTYTFRHIIDTPSVPGMVPWSRAWNRGQLRLVAQRVNPLTGAFETDVQRSVPLWSDAASLGSAMFSDAGSGSYPGVDPGLSVIGTGGDTFALWIIATVFVAKEDHYRSNRTVCQANLDCAVPAIWLEEAPLT